MRKRRTLGKQQHGPGEQPLQQIAQSVHNKWQRKGTKKRLRTKKKKAKVTRTHKKRKLAAKRASRLAHMEDQGREDHQGENGAPVHGDPRMEGMDHEEIRHNVVNNALRHRMQVLLSFTLPNCIALTLTQILPFESTSCTNPQSDRPALRTILLVLLPLYSQWTENQV